MRFFLTLLCLIAIKHSNASEIIIDKVKYKLNNKGEAVVISNGYYGNIEIPKTIIIKNKEYIITGIAYQAFANSTKLVSVKLPISVKWIGSRAFEGCIALENINIPDSLLSINYGVFSNCKKLKVIYISKSVEKIGKHAFADCPSLDSIIVDNENPHYTSIKGNLYDKRNYTLIKCMETNIEFNFPKTVTKFLSGAFRNCINIRQLTLSKGINEIPNFAFTNCSSLEKFKIGKNVSTIGLSPFSLCSSLTNIEVDDSNSNYLSIDGLLYTKDTSVLLKSPQNKNTVSIPINVKRIGSSAFYSCPLKKIVIPMNIEIIGNNAFTDCKLLNSIIIIAVKQPSINMGTFYGISTTAIFYVPKNKLELYKNGNSLDWKSFTYRAL